MFFVLITAAFLVPMLLLGLMRFQNMVHVLGRAWARIMVFIAGARVEFENLDLLYRDGPVIIFCNHQSNFDVLALVSQIDLQIRFMAKASLFRIPFFGWAMSGGGHIAVERENRKKAQASLFKAADRIRAGTSVFVFPEGTRGHLDGTMLPFKKGGFLLAKKAGVVLQPITIWGSNRILPPDPRYKFPRIFPGTVRGVIHDPLFPADYEDLGPEEIAERMFSVINRPLDRLRKTAEVMD